MSYNTAHADGGVLIHAGECILLFCDNITMVFHGQDHHGFLGTKRGRLYLTTHRMIFNAKDQSETMQSFSFPFVTLFEVELEQPMFAANYIKGKCRSQPNGNWDGECKFELHFKTGGAIEFAQAMLRAASIAQQIGPQGYDPPPYQPPTSNWYAAPPPAYQADPTGYYGWSPPTNSFPNAPPANSVYVTDMPPPYPGISCPNQEYASRAHLPQQNLWEEPREAMPILHFGDPIGQDPNYNNQFPAADVWAAEAAQRAYYDPNKPQCAYVPPPAYYESPPSFQQASEKKDQ